MDLSENQQTEKGIYKGTWKQNKMDGRGIFKWASGRMYIGSWTNDLKKGIGKLVFKQGNEYQGQF